MAGEAGRALIAGGGIGGLTAALCLARVGFEVAVFERSSEFGDVGAGIQLSPNGTRVLHHLALAPALAACAAVPEATEIRSWRSGKIISRTPLGEAARRAYGFPYYHIHRGDLLYTLVEAAERDSRIELHAGCEVRSFEQDEDVCIRVAGDGGEARYRGFALIGADGIHSTVHAQLFGAEAPTFTGNVAWRALVPAEQLPKGLIAPVAAVWWGPGRHFVHYAVRRRSLVNCVCVVEKTGWEVESWTERGDWEELSADFAGWHSDIQALIRHMDRQSLYKWALFDRPPAARWSRGVVTLLGDACHPMLPFMAQGAATAIEDAAVLAACLDAGEPVASGLRRYEGLRQQRTAMIQRLARRNARLFHLSGFAAWLRNRGAELVGKRILDGVFRYDALAAGRRPTERAASVDY